ncbi:MAG: neutral zinc metallopeptidase [Sphaerotilus natans]|jgi:predicted metalloprotease|uniref:KPN_02809 family neutral zinc metallopeptidase n=1 Tax=Sphaerotilus TaxID=34102 RepID=UPI00203F3A98|nr:MULTISPECIES: neutral zinc metallopeptidase [Sphaerotilus]MCK6402463.1 neutral zinc metallopeptidase [Sphaerotilus sulfidivorans]GKQ58598.1 membrane protein [Sphaerotilus sp. FB-3]
MKWDGQRESSQIEDRRGSGGGGRGGGGIRVGGGRGVGLGTIAVALVAGWIFGINPGTIIGVLGGLEGAAPGATQQAPAPGATRSAPQDENARFVSTVLASTEDIWQETFQASGRDYRKPVLVLYRGSTRSACGTGQAAMGPFYCPGDEKVYLDLGFFETMRRQLGAPGDFAQAYVVAHEVGHHVQHLLGITDRVDALRGRQSEAQANAMSVRLELQADCFAGVWAGRSQQAKNWLEQGDLEEAMNAASQIGDDTLQQNAGGAVRPESFTHGSSAQRMRWFQRGFQSGQVSQCDTFQARSL